MSTQPQRDGADVLRLGDARRAEEACHYRGHEVTERGRQDLPRAQHTNGVKLSEKPTKKGLYINGGRKVVTE